MSIQFIFEEGEADSETCMRGLNILGHAQLIELNIGSRCGGHGKCGADRIVLCKKDQDQVNPPTEIERIQLGGELISQGVRLACQCFPNSDGLKITVGVGEDISPEALAIHRR